MNYINTKGEEIISLKYDKASNFMKVLPQLN